MKISAIELKDFHAFASEYRFDFAGCKNLVIYGENGSGKSSLFRAIVELFGLNSKPIPYEDHRNIFTDPPATDGRVTICFDDGTSATWSCGAERPNGPYVPEIRNRMGCIDYRDLLKTNFIHFGDKVNLFDLMVTVLLPNYPVVLPGGRNSTIGTAWKRVKANTPKTRHAGNLRRAGVAANDFNQALEPELPKLAAKTEELLAYFDNCNVKVEFEFPKVVCDHHKKEFVQKEINLVVTMNGKRLAGHHYFLNEARLSAIALAIYLACLLVSIPPQQPGMLDYPRILVLDDVLIGLDMSNRIPVLEILRKYFSDWQVTLLTYDRVWYEIVQLQTQGNPDWRFDELYLGEAEDGSEFPIHKPHGKGWDFLLERAKFHLRNNDERAAAVYARASFESKIKKYCEDRGVWVKYKTDARKVDGQSLWDGLKHRVADELNRKPSPYPDNARLQGIQARIAPIETFRKIVLNPLSHSGATSITRVEIQGAINEIELLGNALR